MNGKSAPREEIHLIWDGWNTSEGGGRGSDADLGWAVVVANEREFGMHDRPRR